MTRLDHFLRGNKLRLADVSEWSGIPETKLRKIEAGADFRISEFYHLMAACSHLLGRRVRISELFEDVKETI